MKLLQFGCGNMGGAMLAGWLAGGFKPESFTVVDPLLAQAPQGVTLVRETPKGGATYDAVLLGFKPQQLAEAAPAIAPLVGEGTVVLPKCPLKEGELDDAVKAAWAQCSQNGTMQPKLVKMPVMEGMWPYRRRTSSAASLPCWPRWRAGVCVPGRRRGRAGLC